LKNRGDSPEILSSISELTDKVWYNRHQVRREKIEYGEIKVVEKETYSPKDHRERTIQRDIWEGALKSQSREEIRIEQYGSLG
jgi:hypothetical protein